MTTAQLKNEEMIWIDIFPEDTQIVKRHMKAWSTSQLSGQFKSKPQWDITSYLLK